MKIVIVGASGLIGSKLVATLDARGHQTVAASPDTGVNTLTGEGLAHALAGASVVVDVSNASSFEDAAALEFFDTSTRNLLAAQAAAGVRHHVALSVVGTGRLPESGYFRAKRAQEELIEESSIPYSIVRATQFFESLDHIAAQATDDNTVRLPPALIRPIAADDVAGALGVVSVGPPVNGIVEIAGPDRFLLDEVVRARLGASGDSRAVITDPRRPTSVSRRASGASSPATTRTSPTPASKTGSRRRHPRSSQTDTRALPAPDRRTLLSAEARRAGPRSEPPRRGTADVPSSPGPRPSRPARRATAPAAGVRRSTGRRPPR